MEYSLIRFDELKRNKDRSVLTEKQDPYSVQYIIQPIGRVCGSLPMTNFETIIAYNLSYNPPRKALYIYLFVRNKVLRKSLACFPDKLMGLYS